MNMGGRALVPQSGRYPGARSTFFDFGGLIIGDMVQGSPWGYGAQQAGSNTAIESFCRCQFAEIWPFLLDAIYRPCAGFSLCYVRAFVCVMCGICSVLCAGFRL